MGQQSTGHFPHHGRSSRFQVAIKSRMLTASLSLTSMGGR